ncbi:MAG: hypothetical protein ACYC1M_01335 [Armatimonadota bacterium]
MPMKYTRLIGLFALLACFLMSVSGPGNAATTISWSAPTETEVAGNVTVTAFMTSTVNLIGSEIRAVEPSNAVHGELITPIPGTVTYVGYMMPVYFYSVSATWNSVSCHNGTINLSVRAQLPGGTWEEHTKTLTVNNLYFGTEPGKEAFSCLGESTQLPETLVVTVGGKALSNSPITVELMLYEAASATDTSTLRPRLARTITQSISNPGNVTFSWDFKEANGTQSPRGLYSYDIKAWRYANTGYDATYLRSSSVHLLRAVDSNGQQVFGAISKGINDKNTETTTDDDEEFFIRSYRLVDARNKNVDRLHVSMYDYYLTKVFEIESKTLDCQVATHINCHGLGTQATPGMGHEMKIPVPLSACQAASYYRFLTWVVDDDAASDRVHMARRTVAINQFYDDRPILFLDTPTAVIAYVPAKHMNSVRKEMMLAKPRSLFGYPVNCDTWSSDADNTTASYLKIGTPFKRVRASINGGPAPRYVPSGKGSPLTGVCKQGGRREGEPLDEDTIKRLKRSTVGFGQFGSDVRVVSDAVDEPMTYSFRTNLGALIYNGAAVNDAQPNWNEGNLSTLRSVVAWSALKQGRRAMYLVASKNDMTWAATQAMLFSIPSDISAGYNIDVPAITQALMLDGNLASQLHYSAYPPSGYKEMRGIGDDSMKVPDFIALEGGFK